MSDTPMERDLMEPNSQTKTLRNVMLQENKDRAQNFETQGISNKET